MYEFLEVLGVVNPKVHSNREYSKTDKENLEKSSVNPATVYVVYANTRQFY
jgi:hypothetical protein